MMKNLIRILKDYTIGEIGSNISYAMYGMKGKFVRGLAFLFDFK